ncbi:hypothetical protein EMN47_17300 [Prolixibacteraceae bacterium JC049]|nr:hypothetical protein [Prolixibacteraceae bacterium JC049]
MKVFYYLLATVLLGTIALVSCNDTDEIDVTEMVFLKGAGGSSYSSSLENWESLKQKNGSSYVYQTSTYSWTGYSNTTEVKVLNGKVVERIFVEYQSEGTSKKKIGSYKEIGDQLGTNEFGTAPITIDELYKLCVGKYLSADRDKNTIYFEVETSGLMTLCGFVPDGCMDDCYRGIRITAFKWLKTNE